MLQTNGSHLSVAVRADKSVHELHKETQVVCSAKYYRSVHIQGEVLPCVKFHVYEMVVLNSRWCTFSVQLLGFAYCWAEQCNSKYLCDSI